MYFLRTQRLHGLLADLVASLATALLVGCTRGVTAADVGQNQAWTKHPAGLGALSCSEQREITQ